MTMIVKRAIKQEHGFTLIELLVVIAIIGILSSVVLASLNSARVKARDAKRISEVRQIQTALALYYDTYGQYPGSGECGATTPNTRSRRSPHGRSPSSPRGLRLRPSTCGPRSNRIGWSRASRSPSSWSSRTASRSRCPGSRSGSCFLRASFLTRR